MLRKKTLSSIIVVVAALVLQMILLPTAEAVSAYPEPFTVTQPNGRNFQANMNGDEWQNWTTSTMDNKVIVQAQDGYWKYAEISFGELVPTAAKVGIDLAPGSAVNGAEWTEQLTEWSEGPKIPKFYYSSGSISPAAVPPQPAGGPQKVLVLLVNFSGTTIQYSDAVWSNKFFGTIGDTVRNYFAENSAGSFYFDRAAETAGTANDGIIKVTLAYAHPNTGSATGDANRQIVKDALTAADPFINYAAYDTNGNGYIENSELHIVTITAGYERSCGAVTPNVWGHRWALFGSVPPPQLDGKFLGASGYGGYTQQGEIHAISGNHMATIGILCHELSHDLGAPDLYDTVSGAAVVGASSLMDGGSWGMGPTDYPGGSPAHLDPWDKQYLGFASATVVNSGIHTLNAAVTGSYNMLRFNTTNPDEYFLIENRNRAGYDDGLYYDGIMNGGVAVWHIQEGIIGTYKASNKVNVSGHNPGVWLEKSVSSAEPYYRNGGPKQIFGNTTTPNSKLYSGAASGLELTALDPTNPIARVQLGSNPSVQFAPSTYTVAETTGTVSLTVTRTIDTTGVLTVDYTTANGTALGGSDYTASSGTLSFADGETSKTITVPLLNDGYFEGNETFTVTLSNASVGAIGVPTATVTITSEDLKPVVGFNPTSFTVNENTGPAVLRVVRSVNTAGSVTLDFHTVNVSAFLGSDYSTANGTITFADGETVKTFNIDIIDDSLVEPNEFVGVVLSNAVGANISGSNAFLNIVDNDVATALVAFNPTSYTAAENAGSVNITVSRTGETTGTTTVDYTTTDGTAAAGSDFVAASGTISFAPGEVAKTITVNLTDDAVIEGNETFSLNLSNISAGIITSATATVNITDNDSLISFNPTVYTAAEGDGSIDLNLERTGTTTTEVTVDYSTLAGTAAEGSDYTGSSGTLTFAVGETSKTITIPILEDAQSESNETFTVELTNGTNGSSVGSATANITILGGDAPVIDFDPSSYEAAEDIGNIELTVTRSGDSTPEVSIDYATANNTAQAGSDYGAASGTISFGAGETSKTISISIIDNSTSEGAESFRVLLSNPGGGVALGADTAVITITDNDSGGGTGTVIKIQYGGNITNAAVGVGQTKTVTLLGITEDGGSLDITALATWETTNPGVATVNGGSITAIAAGSTVIKATYNGMVCKLTVVVR